MPTVPEMFVAKQRGKVPGGERRIGTSADLGLQTDEQRTAVREKALAVLEQTGAYRACREILATYLPLGRIDERPALGGFQGNSFEQRQVGVALRVRGNASGDAGYYEGEQFMVVADVEQGCMFVLSGKRPFAMPLHPEEVPTEAKKQFLLGAIARAFMNPGIYFWCEGMGDEGFRYRES